MGVNKSGRGQNRHGRGSLKAVRGSTFLENDRGVYESGRWSTFWKIIGRLRKRLGSKLLGKW